MKRLVDSNFFYEEPGNLKNPDNKSRIREDLGKIKKLAESIKHYGQIQPVLVTDDKELICGGRRVAACIMAKVKVLCAFTKDVSKLRLRELELEENLVRKDFTPAEEALAIAEIHELKVKEFGVPNNGIGWKLKDTAELLGTSEMSIRRAKKVAEAVKIFPELKNVKTAKGIEIAVDKVVAATKSVEYINRARASKSGSKVIQLIESRLVNTDWLKFARSQPDNSFDLILADPPYGLDIDKTANAFTKAEHPTGKFDDSKKIADECYTDLAYHSYRLTGSDGHCFIFVSPEYSQKVKEWFCSCGWLTNHRPIIWTKPGGGQSTQSTKWPVSAYEMILYFRKQESILNTQGLSDFFNTLRVNSNNKIHPTEKPVELIEYLMKFPSLRRRKVFDPFLGSGVTAEYCIFNNYDFYGTEIDHKFHSRAMERVIKTLTEKV